MRRKVSVEAKIVDVNEVRVKNAVSDVLVFKDFIQVQLQLAGGGYISVQIERPLIID